MLRHLRILAIAAGAMLFGTALDAQPLTALDSAFATHGILEVDSLKLSGAGRLYMALQPDGKILTAGTYGYHSGGQYRMGAQLMRFHSSGTRDSSFGQAGALWLPGRANDVTIGLQLMSDGRIVTATASGFFQGNGYTLYRLLPNGNSDPSFNDSGKFVHSPTTTQGHIYYHSLAVQSDGGILFSGHWDQPGLYHFLNTFRHTSAGIPDSSYGYFGRGSVGMSNTYLVTGGVLLPQADGKFFVGGYARDTPLWHNRNVPFLTRCLPTGVLDNTFASGSGFVKYVTAGERHGQVTSVVVHPSTGKILVATISQRRYDGPFICAVRQLTAAGELDPTFGAGGTAEVDSTDNNAVWDALPQLALQADGRVLLSFSDGVDGVAQKFAVRRLTTSGAPDATFGTGGKVTTRVSASRPGGASAIAVQPNGRILVAGTNVHSMSGYTTVGVVRYHPYISFSSVPAASGAGKPSALRLYPNPAHSEAVRLEYQLPTATEVRIELRDVQGRTAILLLDAKRASGANTDDLHLPSSLAPGSYILSVRGVDCASSAVLVKQ